MKKADLNNNTVIAHKLAAMRMLNPKLTQPEVVRKILLADGEENPDRSMADYEAYKEFLTYKVALFWDPKPKVN